MVSAVAFVGRPNVGESALSNRLTRTRDTLVVDFSGLTRDRKHSRVEIGGREFTYIDTGGIDGTEDGVETRVTEQSPLVIEETDAVLFMADARAGLMSADEVIAKHLRSRQKPTSLVASKTDGLDPDQAAADFYSLGPGEIYPIAASHGRGVLNLLERVPLPWVDDVALQEEVDEDAGYRAQLEAKENDEGEPEDDFNPQDSPIKLAIVGRPNVGKSTLTNRTLGEDRVVVYNMSGTACDSICIPMQHDEHEYVLTDIAGVRRRGKITEAVKEFSVIKTPQAIEDANMVMLVVDARGGISDQGLPLLGSILNSGRSLVIVVNKWDGLTQEVREQVKEMLDSRLDFIDFACVHLISALHDSGVGNLFESAREAYDDSTRRMSTVMLMHIMTMAVEDHQPPLVRGRRVKLKYAHAGGYSSPIVVIHGNQVKDPPDSYKRCLVNYSHKSLDVMGTPIRIQFKEGENPFANKCNTLTLTQMRKRKHLIKHTKRSK